MEQIQPSERRHPNEVTDLFLRVYEEHIVSAVSAACELDVSVVSLAIAWLPDKEERDGMCETVTSGGLLITDDDTGIALVSSVLYILTEGLEQITTKGAELSKLALIVDALNKTFKQTLPLVYDKTTDRKPS